MADNPYYNDPYLAKIASNIAGIFVDKNPGQTLVNREHAGYLQRESAKLDRESQGRSKLGALFRSQTLDPREIGATGIESDVPVGQVSGYTLYNKANTGAPDSEVARAFVGSGHGLNKGEGVSLGDRENIRSTDATNDLNRSTAVAGIGAGATIQAANIHEAGQDRRQYREPIHVAPGTGIILNPGDTRTPTDMTPGSTYVPIPAKPAADHFVQSVDEATGKTVWRQAADGIPGPPAKADRFVESTDEKGATTYQPVAPGLPAKAAGIGADKTVVVEGPNGKPVYKQASDAVKNGDVATTARTPADPAANAKMVHDIELMAADDVGAVEYNDAGKPTALNAEFKKMYGPKLEGAKQAAADAYQRTRNAADGIAAYRSYLGIQPGSTFKPAGTPLIGSGPAAMVPPAGAAPPAAAAPVPAPSATLPPSAAGALKEGVQTKFGNGQVWTKQNGVPVQVQ